MKSRRSNSIQSENSEEREKIKNALQEKISTQYEVKIPHQNALNIKIIGMLFEYKEN